MKTFTLEVKKRFEIVRSDEQLSSHSGLALIGAILDRTNIRERLDAVMLPEHPFTEISHSEVATAMIGLICVGKLNFDAIEPFRNDPFFAQSPGYGAIQPDSQAASSARGVLSDIILEESAGVVGRLAPMITPCHGNLVAVDIDVSPFNNSKTKKEGVRLIRNSIAMPPSLAMWEKRGTWRTWNCVQEVTIARKGQRPF